MDETVHKLAKGFNEIYEPTLVTINAHLKELTERQKSVQAMITSERRRLEDVQNDADLDALMANIATDKERLIDISASMKDIHKRVQALQVRAIIIENAATLKNSQNNSSNIHL